MSKAYKITSVLFIILILTAGLWVPQGLFSFIPKCWFESWFHLPCPGCGLTRSFIALSTGNIIQSFIFNAAGPLLFVIFAFMAYENTRSYFNPNYQNLLTGRLALNISSIFVLILFGQWVIKLVIIFLR